MQWEDLPTLPFDDQVDLVVRVVAKLYGAEPRTVRSRSRTQPAARARHHAMYLLRVYGRHKLETIAGAFGVDHSAVSYAVRRVRAGELEDEHNHNHREHEGGTREYH